MKVCVIDDDPLMLRHIEDMLQRMKFQVMTADSIDKGLAVVEKWRPDAVVLDILLPDRDGLNFIMETREHHDRMRIVAITGGGMLGAAPVLEMASGLGAHATLRKPITEDALHAALTGR